MDNNNSVSKVPQVLLTDTVGFIQKLPTNLIAAFRATLEEIEEADILLHVADISNEAWRKQEAAVLSELASMGLSHKPMITVWNKIDSIPEYKEYVKLQAKKRQEAYYQLQANEAEATVAALSMQALQQAEQQSADELADEQTDDDQWLLARRVNQPLLQVQDDINGDSLAAVLTADDSSKRKARSASAAATIMPTVTNTIAISAKTGEGFDHLLATLEETILSSMEEISCEIPYTMQSLVAILHRLGSVQHVIYHSEYVEVQGKVPRFLYEQLVRLSQQPVEEGDDDNDEEMEVIDDGYDEEDEEASLDRLMLDEEEDELAADEDDVEEDVFAKLTDVEQEDQVEEEEEDGNEEVAMTVDRFLATSNGQQRCRNMQPHHIPSHRRHGQLLDEDEGEESIGYAYNQRSPVNKYGRKGKQQRKSSRGSLVADDAADNDVILSSTTTTTTTTTRKQQQQEADTAADKANKKKTAKADIVASTTRRFILIDKTVTTTTTTTTTTRTRMLTTADDSEGDTDNDLQAAAIGSPDSEGAGEEEQEEIDWIGLAKGRHEAVKSFDAKRQGQQSQGQHSGSKKNNNKGSKRQSRK